MTLRERLSHFRNAIRAVKLAYIPGHYFSPICNPAEIRLRYRDPKRGAAVNLPGIDLNTERQLERMAEREEPLVSRLARQPGQKEERWSELVGPVIWDDKTVDDQIEVARPALSTFNELAAEVAALRDEVAELRMALEDLRSNLGG